MSRYAKPAEGSWTAHYGLGLGPVSYEDSVSPEFYELEWEAVFKRAWLNVGRAEQLQDANTLEATQSMLESRAVGVFSLNDQEVLCRHLHLVAAEWVNDYQKEREGARL